MLEKLQKKFKQELDAVEEAESNSVHAYDLENLHLKNTLDAANGDLTQKTETKAQRAADSAEAKGQLADAQTALAAAEKYMTDVTQTFRQKTQAFEANQQVRTEELVAINMAIEIISGGAVSGSAEKHLLTLVQRPKAVSFLQVSSTSRSTALLSKYHLSSASVLRRLVRKYSPWLLCAFLSTPLPRLSR